MRTIRGSQVATGSGRLFAAVTGGLAIATCLLAASCGGSSPVAIASSPALEASIPAPSGAGSARLLDWSEFGYDPQRSDATGLSPGITAANVAHLHRTTIRLSGTVDSSPVYVHGAFVEGTRRDVVLVETDYGRALAIDAGDGQILWTFTPRGYSSWAGSAQITVSTPLVDRNRRVLYTTSPNGLIHKLSLSDGAEVSGAAWPVSVTQGPHSTRSSARR